MLLSLVIVLLLCRNRYYYGPYWGYRRFRGPFYGGCGPYGPAFYGYPPGYGYPYSYGAYGRPWGPGYGRPYPW